MAKQKHIQWLCESVDSWNAKRLEARDTFDPAFFRPDFTEADLSSELLGSVHKKRRGLWVEGFFLDGINLSYGLFQDAELPHFSFRKADLRYSNFERASLFDSDLRKASLTGAKLTGADLSHADVRGAELAGADFTRANLGRAELNGTNLKDAILIGADIAYTKPWTSILFPDPKVLVTKTRKFRNRVKKVGDLIRIRQSFEKYYENKLEGTSFNDNYMFYFRGEGDDSWELCPSVMRNSPEGKATLRDKEGEMLLDLMSQRPEDFIGATSALSQWVIAQHHGLKTRLLDITRNPLVALFHACERPQGSNNGTLHVFVVPKDIVKTFDSDAVSIIANLAKLPRSEQDILMGGNLEEDEEDSIPLYEGNEYLPIMDRLYNHIWQEKPHFKERIDIRDFFRVFVVEAQQSFERIRAQSGAFLISAFHKRFETKKILELNKNTPVYHHYKLTVPTDSKDGILDELKFLNVTREVLFPGLDESAEAIVERCEERNSRKME